jgi:hypothetical protein
VHIVADRIEDFTPWLAALREGSGMPVAKDAADTGGPASNGQGRFTPPHQEAAALAHETQKVMPKGRNFQ